MQISPFSRRPIHSYMLSGEHRRNDIIVFHDDTSSEEVARQTAKTIREAARMIGKADRGVHNADIQELQLAMIELEKALDFKASSNADRT